MSENQIDIQVKTEASNATKELSNVDKALANIQSSLTEISGTLTNLSGKISPISRAMNRLAGDMEKLHPEVFNKVGSSARKAADDIDKAANSVDKASDKINSAVKEAADSLSNSFGIKGKDNISQLKQALTEYYNQIEKVNSAAKVGDDAGWKTAYAGYNELKDSLTELIGKLGSVKREIYDVDRELLNFVRDANAKGSKIFLEDEIKQEYGDAFKDMRATLGAAFTSVKKDATTEFDSWISEIREAYGLSDNVAEAFGQLVERIRAAKTETLSLDDAIRSGVADGEGLKYAINGIDKKFMDLSSELIEYRNNSSAIGESASEIQQIADNASQASANFSEMADNAQQAMGNIQAELGAIKNEDLSDTVNLNELNKKLLDFTSDIQAQMSDIEIKLPEIDTSSIEEAKKEVEEAVSSMARPDNWGSVITDIEQAYADYDKLANSIGETNAQLQTYQDIANRVKGAFSATASGKMLFDTENMRLANGYMKEAQGHLDKFKDDLNKQYSFKIDTVEPKSELGQLYNKAKELQELLSDMRNNRIQFDTTDVQNAVRELETINEQIKELEYGESKPKIGGSAPEKTGSLEWMAQIVAIQHELEKASQSFSRFGDIAKNALMKALIPLKLFKHEFEEIKGLITAVSRVGSAFAMISKPITKVFKNMQAQASKAFAKIQKAWGKVARTFTFMLIRKAITKILSDINDATQSLAAFSKNIGTPFNDTMSLLTSDLRYIAASIVGVFSTILNAAIPTLDSLADAIVAVINKVNMFLAIITGAKSYTIAKKKIVDYTEATKDASKAVKQLTMGIDELNILNDNQSSEEQAVEDMFDWQELATPQIEIPDWLKWIKELLQKIWNLIKAFFKALWDAIKEAWERVKEFFLNALRHLIEAIIGLIEAIITDFIRLFNTEKFKEFLARLMRIVAKIMEFIAIIVDKIKEAWKYNDLGYKILEAILDILNTIAIHIENILDKMIAWAHDLTFIPLFESILVLLQKVNYAVDQLGWVIEDVADLVLIILKKVIEDYLPRLLLVLGDVIEGIGNIFKKLHEGWQEVDFTERFAAAFDGIVQAIIPHLEEVGEYFKEWANGLDFKPVLNAIIELFLSLIPVANFVGGVFEDLVKDYILPLTKHLVEEVIPEIANAISNFAKKVNWSKLRANIDKVIKAFLHISEAVGQGVAKALDKLGSMFGDFLNSDAFSDFVDTITGFMQKIDGDMVAKILEAIGIAIGKIAKALVDFVNSDTFKGFLDALIKFVKDKSAEQLADMLVKIAKAFLAFKGLSFLAKIGSEILSFLALIGKAVEGITSLQTLLGGLGSAGAGAGTGISSALSPVVGVIAAITAAIYSMISSFGGITGLLDELKSHVDNIADTIKRLVVSFGIDKEIKKIQNAFKKLMGKIKEMVGSLGDLKGAWQVLFKWWELLARAATNLLAPAFRVILSAIEVVVNGLAFFVDTIRTVIEIVGGLGEIVHGVFTGDFGEAAEGLKRIIDALKEHFQSFVDTFISIAGTWVQTVIDMVKGFVEGIFNFFKWLKYVLIGDPIVIEMWEGILKVFSDAIAQIIEFVSRLVQDIVDFFTGLWEKTVEIWTNIVNSICEIFGTLGEKIAEVWQVIHDWFVETWEAFKAWVGEIWAAIVQTIIDAWNTFVATIQAIWEKFYTWLSETWTAFKEWCAQIWGEIIQGIIDWWNNLVKTVTKIWTEFSEWITEQWNKFKEFALKLWKEIRDFIVACWEFVKKKTIEIWKAIKTFLSEIWDWMKNTVKAVFEYIKNKIIEVWEKIHQKTVEIWNAIQSFLTSVWQELKDFCNRIFSWMKDFLLGIWNMIKSTWEHIWNSIKNMLEDMWTAIKTICEALFTAIRGFLNVIWNGLEDLWKTIWEGITNAVKKVWEWLLKKAEEIYKDIKDAIAKKWDEIKAEAQTRWEAITAMLKMKWEHLCALAKKVFDELAHIIWVAWTKIKNTVSDTWNGVKEFIHGVAEETTKLVDKLENAISKLIEVKQKKEEAFSVKEGKPFWQVEGFADGGFPKKGEIFVAQEKGPELVGKINGKTAVANQSEITQAIENAVEEVMGDIAEEINVAMTKLVQELQAGLDKIVEKVELLSDRMVERLEKLVTEVQFVRAVIHEMISMEMDLIKETWSEAKGLLTALADAVIYSNRKLEDAYRNDDSAVKTAISDMSDSYQFSNDKMIDYFNELSDTFKGGFDAMSGTMESGFSSMINVLESINSLVSSTSSSLISTLASVDTATNRAESTYGIDTIANTLGEYLRPLSSKLDDVKDATTDVSMVIIETAETFLELAEAITRIMMEYFSTNLKFLAKIGEATTGIATKGYGVNIPMFANGGFPEDGLFYANHNEIIGGFNGRTAVANNDMITSGIAQAVSGSLVPILNDIAASSKVTASKELSLSIDSREVARANNTGQDKLGKSLVTFT